MAKERKDKKKDVVRKMNVKEVGEKFVPVRHYPIEVRREKTRRISFI